MILLGTLAAEGSAGFILRTFGELFERGRLRPGRVGAVDFASSTSPPPPRWCKGTIRSLGIHEISIEVEPPLFILLSTTERGVESADVLKLLLRENLSEDEMLPNSWSLVGGVIESRDRVELSPVGGLDLDELSPVCGRDLVELSLV